MPAKPGCPPALVAVEGALEGRALRSVRTLFVAEDETYFHVFEAPSRDALVEAARSAGLTHVRVTEAVESEEEGRAAGAPSDGERYSPLRRSASSRCS